MTNKVISGLLVLAGAIHLLPLRGILGPDHLTVLYGIPFEEPNLQILMRHRALLFGLLGALLLYAAFKPFLQRYALIAGLLSTSAFIWLVWSVGEFNAAMRVVVIADVVALVCLAVVAGLHVVTVLGVEKNSLNR